MADASDIIAMPEPAMTAGPMVRFDPSQRRFFDDDARVISVNWHRQKGKDFTAAGKAVKTAAKNGKHWYLTSLTQRQADATFQKADKFVEAYKKILKLKGRIGYGEEEYAEYDREIDHTFKRTARKLFLPNKAEIVSLPGKDPDTLAGLTGNIILTEFGLFPGGGYDHWRVIFPLTTRGFQAIAISTPRGKKSKFFELCSAPDTYSYHFCPITKSVAEDGFKLFDNKGRPCSIEQFKKLYGDDSGWLREYECQFTGDMDALIPWAQLLAAQTADVQTRVLRVTDGNGWEESFFDFVRSLPPGRLEMGWDVARHRDLSVLTVNHARHDGKKALVAMVIMANCPFDMMRHIIIRAMNARGGSVGCGDATGLGMESNEKLKAVFRDNWEPVTFGTKSKSELGSIGRTAFMDGVQLLPAFMTPTKGGECPTKFIATDFYSIQCQPSGDPADKRLLLSETENELEPDSHCDIAYSGLLALKAGTLRGGRNRPLSKPVRKPRGC